MLKTKKKKPNPVLNWAVASEVDYWKKRVTQYPSKTIWKVTDPQYRRYEITPGTPWDLAHLLDLRVRLEALLNEDAQWAWRPQRANTMS